MIREYAASIRGKSHIKSGTVCQDAISILALPNGYKVAAVADGVGSCKHADKGAQIAVRTVTDFIKENYPIDNRPISVKSMLRTAYNRALIEIQKEASHTNTPLSDYDTTLMVVIHDGKHGGYYAHVGDGGIIGLRTDGRYTEISQRQNIEGRVIPLRAGYEFWEIDEIKDPIASVLVCTDGMMDQFKNSNLEQGFYVPLLMLFADPYCIQYEKKKGVNIAKVVTHGGTGYSKVLMNALYTALLKNYHLKKNVCAKIVGDVMRNGTPFELLQKIQDDKTFVCLYNTQVFPKAQGIFYYSEPDWKQVTANLQRRLYPSMFSEEAGTENKEPPSEPVVRKDVTTDVSVGGISRVLLRLRKNE